MLGLVLARILGLFGLMFDWFWDHFGFPRSESIFRNLVLLGLHVVSSGAPFWKPGDVQMVDFNGLGLTSGFIFGHASGGSLCSKGGLDRF